MANLANVRQYVQLLVLLVLAVMQQPANPYLVVPQHPHRTMKALGRLHPVQRLLRSVQSNTIVTPSSPLGTSTYHSSSIAIDLSSVGWGILSVSGADRYRVRS